MQYTPVADVSISKSAYRSLWLCYMRWIWCSSLLYPSIKRLAKTWPNAWPSRGCVLYISISRAGDRLILPYL